MIAYDLHVHTCLSPGTDDNMTPTKVIDKAIENGLDIIAITDSNATDNLSAAMEYSKGKDIAIIPGIEITSSEEVQLICLFDNLTNAERMGRIMRMNMHDKKNKVRAFGHQYVVDEFDEIIREESKLLNFPTKMTAEEIILSTKQMGGVAIYGQADSRASGVIPVLGSVPSWPPVNAIDFSNTSKGRNYSDRNRVKYRQLFFYSSNAQKLDDINTSDNSGDFEVFAEEIRGEDGKITGENFIKWLREFEVK